ncbi:MAG: amidophosphoribosyltransferase, partial [Syntrophales bacterium]|nr:amidophosphoribosyltransferase [Syntrophales bacterium]
MRGELIAAEKEDESKIASFIGLDGLHYLSLGGMVEATGMSRESFCLACYTGDYPLPPPATFGKFCFEGHLF